MTYLRNPQILQKAGKAFLDYALEGCDYRDIDYDFHDETEARYTRSDLQQAFNVGYNDCRAEFMRIAADIALEDDSAAKKRKPKSKYAVFDELDDDGCDCD